MKDGELIADYTAAAELRMAIPEGTHTPDQQCLQQLWVAVAKDGSILKQWRDVPRVVVQKGKEHE
jgi:hypothetical protein